MKAWYLVHSKPKQEFLAEEHLQRQGYVTYLPLLPLRRIKNRKSTRAIGPMFPRYLFIELCDTTDDWRPIRSTIGVSSLIRFGGTPAKVPGQLLESIRAREDENGVCILPGTLYKEGDNVRIAEGPFQGYEAVFESRQGKERVSLLLKIIEKNVRIDLHQSNIEAIL